MHADARRGTGPRLRGLTVAMLVAGAGLVPLAGGRMRSLPPGITADRIVVEKALRRLTLYREGVALKSYRVALGREPVGPKEIRGDNRTPEGTYSIDWRKPDSQYHKALHISYPTREDRARARQRGQPPGGDIMIHGLPNGLDWIGPGHHAADWTAGCVAVTNPEIEELWAAVPDGTPIEIRP